MYNYSLVVFVTKHGVAVMAAAQLQAGGYLRSRRNV